MEPVMPVYLLSKRYMMAAGVDTSNQLSNFSSAKDE